MNYTDQIKNDMYVAMKSGDKIKTNILKTLLSMLKEKQMKKKGI
jgi:Yqey-like protein.